MKTILTFQHYNELLRKIRTIRSELQAFDEGRLSRTFHARQWEHLFDELADLHENAERQERIDAETHC